MDIEAIILQTSVLPADSLQRLVDIVHPVQLPKGYRLFQAGKIEQTIYFISQGIARIYYYHEANEVTLCFGMEGEALVSLNSYVQQQRGYENVELLEPCDLFCLHVSELYSLYTADIHIANWGRKLAEQELLKTEARLMSKLFKTASERYRELIREQPRLLQRVQLSHIASYLGISQVTLSRIRAEIK